MAQVRARVEARIRREAAAREAAVERKREPAPAPAPAPAPERGRGAAQPECESASVALPPSESFSFHGNSIYWSSRGGGVGKLLHASRRLLAPLVKFVFNIDPMVDALAIQARRNAQQAAFDDDVARRLAAREEQDALNRRAVEAMTVQMERLAADMKGHRTLVATVVERLDALDRSRAGEPAAKPQGDPTPLPPRGAGERNRGGERGDRQADEHTDDNAPPTAADAPSSGGQADERTDDNAPPTAAAPPTPNR